MGPWPSGRHLKLSTSLGPSNGLTIIADVCKKGFSRSYRCAKYPNRGVVSLGMVWAGDIFFREVFPVEISDGVISFPPYAHRSTALSSPSMQRPMQSLA